MKDCIQFIKEEELKDGWEFVKGFMLLQNWFPFSHVAMVLDYKDIIEYNMLINGCRFTYYKDVYLELAEDPDYVVKFIKFPKYDKDNFQKIGNVIAFSVDEVIKKGATKYVAQFDKINAATDEYRLD